MTLDLPMRPEIGAVMAVYPRLMRTVLSAASACWMVASAAAIAFRSLSTCASAACRAVPATSASVTAWSRWLAETALSLKASSNRSPLVRARSRVARCRVTLARLACSAARARSAFFCVTTKIGRGVVHGCLEGGRIDLVERLAGLDLGSLPSKSRFWMRPPTWGRTSATRWAEVRPVNSVVISNRCGCTVTTATSGGPPCGGPPVVALPATAQDQ